MKSHRTPAFSLPLLSYPSFVIGIGYLLFYSQMACRWWTPDSRSSVFLTVFAGATLVVGLGLGAYQLYGFSRATYLEGGERAERRIVGWLCFLLFAFLVLALLSALKPAHLIQESDFANYHLMLPKQHWLAGNWRPLEWSVFEFRTMVLQYGFSFLWVGLPLLNKLPQYLLLVFLVLKLWGWFSISGGKNPWFSGLVAVLTLLSFRGFAIQAGMAMLDLPTIYFLVSMALLTVYLRHEPTAANEPPESARALKWLSLLFGIDAAAYLGHKSFGIVFLVVVLAVSEALERVIYSGSLLSGLRKLRWGWVLIPIGGLWGVNLCRSFYYSGDPLYPVFIPLTKMFCDPSHLASTDCAGLVKVAQYLRTIVAQYGYGHDLWSCVKTFFVLPLSVGGLSPVNNVFDYPLGLMWYLGWAVLATAALLSKSLRSRALFGLGLGLVFYLVWFEGSQQSRWLYPVLVLMALCLGSFAGTLWARRDILKSRLNQGAILCSIVLTAFVSINAVRMVRAQRSTLACFGVECLKTRANYFDDYERKCPDKPLIVTDLNERGYLSCLFAPK